jgi:signal transduction histidine kinase
MKIRTQLIISVVLFCVALLIIATSMVMTNQQVDQLNKQQELVKNIELGAGELGYLSNDYLLYNETQQLDRWNSKYAGFSEDVSNLSVDTPEQQVLVNTIKASQQRLKDVFSDVVSTLEDGNLANNSSADKAYIQVSWSRLAVQTRGIIFDASRLSQMLHNEENQVKQTNTLIILTLMGAFVAFLLIDYLLIFGRAIKSIANLHAGTKIIGSGNLDHTIKANKGDEIGELAEAFNQMTVRLKNVTASKSDLEREITERKQAEVEKEQLLLQLKAKTTHLQQVNEELEVKGEELAAQAEELKCTNEELRTHNDELQSVTRSLRETQDYLENLINYANAPIIVWDPRFTIVNSANIYDEDKTLLATIAQGQDITRRKKAEKDLEDAKAQAELYLDLMGHDISNMHQIMLMQLELAADILKMEGKLAGDNKELIDSSIRTLDKAARLINNVRKLQKHQSGEFSLEPVDLTVTLKDVLKDYTDLPGRDVTIKYVPDGKSMVRANPLLKDVFSNIVDNAVKHSGSPLVLVVNVSKVSLNDSAYYRVTIEDNGNGIPDEKKEEVFHRFKRGPTKARGTGLGLYIVKTLVEGFGGYVEVQNRVLDDYTQGTRFLVYLPAMEEDHA